MRTDIVRAVTTRMPVPGRMLRRILDRYDRLLTYPSSPQIVRSSTSFSCFEIRDFREYIQRNIYFLGYYEIRESRLVRSILRSGDTFVDIGANIGWFTLLAAHAVGPSGSVVAFEPAARVYDHLLANITLNRYANVLVSNFAVSDRTGIACLTASSPRNAGTATILPERRLSNSFETVQTVTFDQYWSESGFRPIRMMKIDVEGAEELVLHGLTDVLRRHVCSHFLIEVTERSAQNVAAILGDSGYVARAVGALGPRPIATSELVKERNVLFSLAA